MFIKNRGRQLILFFVLFSLIVSCATFHEQRGADLKNEQFSFSNSKEISHRFILLGDTNGELNSNVETNINIIKSTLSESIAPSTVLFLGNNINETKAVDKNAIINEKNIKKQLDNNLDIIRNFNSNTFFLSGTNDWKYGLDGLIFQKKYITTKLKDSLAFLPQNYDAISEVEINDLVSMIVIDSEWFIQDWNKYPNINHKSEFRSREDLFEKFRYLVNKNQNKITLVAIHHPILSGGEHGGYYSFNQEIYPINYIPLPFAGTIYNYWKRTSGINPKDMQYKPYQSLIKKIKTIIAHQPQVVLVSGHENNLQFIKENKIKQIISGSSSKVKAARAISPVSFTAGVLGFAELNIYKDKSVELNFITSENNKKEIIFSEVIYDEKPSNFVYTKLDKQKVKKAVYTKDEIQKGFLHKTIFGKHFRDTYTSEITTQVAYLDTLFGGISPIISDRDDQSYFLKLKDQQGNFYKMQRIRKSPELFLESLIFKEINLEGKIEKTYLADFINDFYTSAHPYIPLVTNELEKQLKLNSNNSKLYYIPKQDVLGNYNLNFGNEMYIISNYYPKSENSTFSIDNIKENDIITTEELLFLLECNTNHSIDTELYLRMRIFDFLIGDWNRHPNQWSWQAIVKNDTFVFKPISTIRKHAFSKMDGLGFALLRQAPVFRHMFGFKEKYPNPRWINKSTFPLDKALLETTNLTDWQNTAKQISDSLSNKIIDEAFSVLPEEVLNSDIVKTKKTLIKRRDGLVDFSEKYFAELMKYGIVFGTNSKNRFEIQSTSNQIDVSVLEENKDDVIKKISYNSKLTKELWVYGLAGEDNFIVKGTKSPIKIRLMGGANHDSYEIKSRNRVIIHDYKSEENTIDKSWKTSVLLRDNYVLNRYDYRNVPINIFKIIPDLDYNKDNGIMLGVNAKLTRKKFHQENFFQEHNLRAKFDFATDGANLDYIAKIRNNTRNWFYQIEFNAKSANYTQNFFGFGNQTTYSKDLFKENYYRIRTEQLLIYPSYNYLGRNGGQFLIGPTLESIKIIDTKNRFIDQDPSNHDYTSNKFVGIQAKYEFKNYNSSGNPTLGFHYLLHTGFKSLFKEFNNNHSFVTSSLGFIIPVNISQTISLESVLYGKTIFGQSYNFYHAADLGSDNYLRGYRADRFTGRSAFAQSTDLNFKIYEVNKGLLPFTYGLSLGFDYGRVWQDHDHSKMWHTNYGGGIWFNFLEVMRLKINMHKSSEEIMLTFGLNFEV